MKNLLSKLFFIALVLSAQTLFAQFSGGDGSVGNPWQITTAAQLNLIRGYGYSLDSFILENDIALTDYQSGSGWVPIGTDNIFQGNFFGNNHKVTGLVINTTADNQGLFGRISGSTINNLGVDVDITMTGAGSNCGGLIGYTQGNCTITSCYSTGNITNTTSNYVENNVGGLIGTITGSSNTSTISNCYSRVNVKGWSWVGGLVGSTDAGNISNCYCIGSVTGNNIYIGGLIGYFTAGTSTNVLSKCYSTGAVSHGGISDWGGMIGAIGGASTYITACFWDLETSGQPNSAGGTGVVACSTTVMKTQATFTGATPSWDFTTTWEIVSGFYPRLQNPRDPSLPVELTTFTSVVNKNSVTLNWSTATEVNNYGFEIERRTVKSEQQTVNNWQKIGFVQGAGTSNSLHKYSYSDASLVSGEYAYRLKQIDNDGTFKYSQSVEQEVSLLPATIGLSQNYPNPFNPSTQISFAISKTEQTKLVVYNILGQPVMTLFDGVAIGQQAYQLSFDASKLASGVYFYKLETPSRIDVKRMQLLK